MQQVQLGAAVSNANWVAPDDVADPTPLPDIPGYHVLVRPVQVVGKTKGGIILPDQFKDDVAYLTTVGRVLAIGDIAYKDEKKFPNGAWCKVGDYVCYGKHTGTKMRYKGVQLILMYDDQIIMRVDNPADLDTSFNLVSGGTAFA